MIKRKRMPERHSLGGQLRILWGDYVRATGYLTYGPHLNQIVMGLKGW